MGIDAAGGVQLGNSAAKFKVRGAAVVCIGDSVASHPPFPPHIGSPTMVSGSSKFKVNGIPVCREGDAASCGHTTSGRGFFRVP